jgi:hypothetical protein
MKEEENHRFQNDMKEWIWTFDLVQLRLIEAVEFNYRLPDRERGWLRGAGGSVFSQMVRSVNEGDWMDTTPARPGLTRDQYARMMAALEWITWVPARRDRLIVIDAVEQLAKGASRVSWTHLRRRRGWRDATTDGLRMAYSRAISIVCRRLNGEIDPCDGQDLFSSVCEKRAITDA